MDFVAFSCLSGSQNEMEENLGALFTPKKVKALQDFVSEELVVIVDDIEPARIWLWETPQEEITEWLRLVKETRVLPEGWKVELWSDLEKMSRVNYGEILKKFREPRNALHVHKFFLHMKKFPNKKANFNSGNALREAALRRSAHYALQGVVLEELFPSATLLQTETPWAVKDPLYQPLRTRKIPIIHPFEERR